MYTSTFTCRMIPHLPPQVYRVTLEHLEGMAHPDKMAYVEIEERKEKPVDLVPPAKEGRGDEGPKE